MYLVSVDLEGRDPLTVSVDGRDVRKWEASTGESFLLTDFSYSILTELARLALVRTGQLSLDRDEFDAVCIGVRQEEQEALDPTPPDRSES